jgi:hypothetical protein
VGDESVEAAGLGGGLQEGTSDCRRTEVGGNRESPSEVHGAACLDGQAMGYVWTRRLVVQADADSKMSQRLAIVSTWEILGGGTALARAPATT